MVRKGFLIAMVILAAGGVIFARSEVASQSPAPAPAPTQPAAGEKKLIDLKADVTGPVTPGDSVIFLVGNFAAQHNGTVITCDSAVRYNDMHIECFGNVLINQKTTYIYGDRAEYNGELNEARVFAPLIKVVDGDATLYTYAFVFNTKKNIGEFSGRGVLLNRENQLESTRGYYYSNTKTLVCVDDVEMRNDEYELTGDSVVYNMATDHAYYYQNTNIWNKEGDYLYADRGEYVKPDSLYSLTLNGYILTEKQELWSDSLDYYRAKEHAILRHNLQIDDTEHKTLAFGNYGEYWKFPGNAFLTRHPSIISYDPEQGDSLFMRADSMFLYTRNTREDARADSLAAAKVLADSLNAVRVPELLKPEAVPDSLHAPVAPQGAPDSLKSAAPDSLAVAGRQVADTTQVAGKTPLIEAADSTVLTPDERKAKLREIADKEKADRKAAAAKVRKEKLDKIAEQRQAKVTALLLAQKERETQWLAAQKLKAESKLRVRQERAARKGKVIAVDSTELQSIESLMSKNASQQDLLAHPQADSLTTDSLARVKTDSLKADSLLASSLAADSLAVPLDSIYRLVKAYHNVKMYRTDFQAVCDSMTAISIDSTIHLYIKPVLWNEANQITSDVMDIFTKNQQIIRAEFVGSPLMASKIDTLHYNQVTGKTMTAFFRNNEIYRNDANGNAQTIYYMQDDATQQVKNLAVVESGNSSFYIEKKKLTGTAYRINPVYSFYPLDKVPPEQELFLKNFKWEGARRPTQAEVFDRTVRPSLRAEKTALPKPDFPITRQIEEYKVQLIQERRWLDRTDRLTPEVNEWMRTRGY